MNRQIRLDCNLRRIFRVGFDRDATFRQAHSFTQVDAGAAFSVAPEDDGSVWQWGGGLLLGFVDVEVACSVGPVTPSPEKLLGLEHVTAVSAGECHVTALLSNGTIVAWGANESGQLGDGTRMDRLEPVKVQGVSGVKQVSAGATHNLALLEDGHVMMWPASDGDLSGIVVEGITSAVQVAAGKGFSLVLMGDGSVRAWGSNTSGQLGDGTMENRDAPAAVSALSNVTSVYAGAKQAFAILEDGLGDGASSFGTATAVVVPNLMSVKQIANGNRHGLALLADGNHAAPEEFVPFRGPGGTGRWRVRRRIWFRFHFHHHERHEFNETVCCPDVDRFRSNRSPQHPVGGIGSERSIAATGPGPRSG